MNVALDHQKNCVVALDINLPAETVNAEWEKISKEFQKQARLPGYRPGKAPAHLVAARYAKDIEDEVKHNLIGISIRNAVKENKIDLEAVQDVDEAVISPDRTMKIRARIVKVPEFELPDYKNLSVEVARGKVTDADIETMLEYLREPHSKFDPVTGRALAMGDYAVLTYEGTVEGKPLKEFVPKAPAQIHGRRNAWVLMSEGTLLPGFAKAIEGMEIGQERTISLDVPESFPVVDLQNKKVEYNVSLTGINSRVLPALDNELASKIEPGSTMVELRAKIRERQQEAAEYQFQVAKKNAVIQKLLGLFTCELPERAVAIETQSILKDIVQDSQARGIADEDIKSKTDEIVNHATENARDRVRANYLLQKIAEKEKIEETEGEIYQAIYEVAERRNVPVKKLAGDLARNGGISRIREQIRIGKALDLVASGATVLEPAEPAKEA